MRILAIDPGPTESAYAVIDSKTRKPLAYAKVNNELLLQGLATTTADHVAIEMIKSYGMPVGREVFETCVWIGRFIERLDPRISHERIYRQPVRLHHCHSPKATDATVRQALVDRFAPGYSNHGKGTKANPSWFYGFRADIWQAMALAVYVADHYEAGTPDTDNVEWAVEGPGPWEQTIPTPGGAE